MLLCADVVWLMELVEPLVGCVEQLAQLNRHVEVLVVHQTRSAQVERAFLEAMARKAFGLAWALEKGGASEIQWHEELKSIKKH